MTLSLITDRTLADVQRVKELAAIGWTDMTADEKDEWLNGNSYVLLLDANGQQILDSNGDPIYVLSDTPAIKGAYNYTDLNRVEGAVETLAQEMQDNLDALSAYLAAHNIAADPIFDMGYSSVPTLTTKTDWTDSDFFAGADGARYLGNIIALGNLIALVEVPQLPDTMDALNYEKANNIEKYLLAIETQGAALLANRLALAERTYPNFFYAAEISCGEV
jgi:hypothetical protein